jgi:NAD(P)-dependent dehydrogenase (short-subunit alcohol dehydrogenase family)
MANETVGTMKDRAAVITGGSRGLGRNTALNLAGRGVNVIFTYRSNQKQADSLIREVERWEGKQRDFDSIPVTFTHLTDSRRVSARRCTVLDDIGSTIW